MQVATRVAPVFYEAVKLSTGPALKKCGLPCNLFDSLLLLLTEFCMQPVLTVNKAGRFRLTVLTRPLFLPLQVPCCVHVCPGGGHHAFHQHSQWCV